MSDIKFDHLDKLHTVLNSRKLQPSNKVQENEKSEKKGITVHLSSLADIKVAEASAADNARVLEMKLRIESNQYQVNTDILAKKILPHLLKSIG